MRKKGEDGKLLNFVKCSETLFLVLVKKVTFTLVDLSVLFYRLKMKFSCMMELNKYPLDVQVCTMEVASCEYYILG